jgi:hypothetical protein
LDEAIAASKGQKIRGLQECLERFQRAHDSVSKDLKDAIVVQKKYYDAQYKPIEFGTGDFVLLSTKNLNIKRPKRSLWPKYVRPFKILEPYRKQAYRLKLPSTWQIHDVINVSRLEKWHGDRHLYERPVIIPDEVEFKNRQEYEVKCIFDHDKDVEGVLHYRVKWAGFDDPEDNIWEPAEYLSSARAKVKEYWHGQKIH